MSLLSATVKSLLEQAFVSELLTSNLYKNLANQMQRQGYFGAAEHFRNESSDELTHYQRIADYLNDRGEVAIVPELPAVNVTATDLGEALEAALSAEMDLEKFYQNAYKKAFEVDVTTAQFLLGFLEIQRKSIGEYGDILTRLARAADNPAALLIIDQELKG